MAACSVCSLCSKPCGSGGAGAAAPHVVPAEEADFVVLDEQIFGASESDAALERLVLLESLADDAGVSSMTESARRIFSIIDGKTRRSIGAAAAEELLERRLASAMHEAELYAKCERQLVAMREDEELAIAEAESTPRKRTSRRKATAAALARLSGAKDDDDDDDEVKALRDALATARKEARLTRGKLMEARMVASSLCAEEETFWHDQTALDLDVTTFRDSCAEMVTRAQRRSTDDAVLEGLAAALASIDRDRANFETIDAYVRTVSKDLSALFDSEK